MSNYSNFPNKNVSPRMATIVIAAKDSPNKGDADVVCTGTADQVLINTAVAAAPAGCQIFFRAGHYYLTDAIVIPAGSAHENLSLVGERIPDWKAWGGGYPSFDTPGVPGGALFIQTVSGKHGFDEQGGHHGMVFESLYVIASTPGTPGDYTTCTSYNFAGTGLNLAGDELSLCMYCKILGFANGLFLNGWDTGRIYRNDIEQCSNIGVFLDGSDINFVDNIVYGNNGVGIWVIGLGSLIQGNQVANNNGPSIWLAGNSIKVIGNEILSTDNNSFPAVWLQKTGISSDSFNNIVVNNTFVMGSSSTSVDCIGVGNTNVGESISDAANNNIITGNILKQSTSSTGFAVGIHNNSTGNIIANNQIAGGGFNSGSISTINWSASSNNYGQGTNVGDSQITTVINNWNPNDVPNLLVQYGMPFNASQLFTTGAGSTHPSTDGDPVGRVVPLIGAFTMTSQNDTTKRAVYKTTGVNLNSNPCINFNGSAQFLRVNTPILVGSTSSPVQSTILAVVRYAAKNTGTTQYYFGNGDTNSGVHTGETNTFHDVSLASNDQWLSQALQLNIWYLVTYTVDANGNSCFYINGSLAVDQTGQYNPHVNGLGKYGVVASNWSSMGAITADGTTGLNFFNGDIAGILMYNRTLNREELDYLWRGIINTFKLC